MERITIAMLALPIGGAVASGCLSGFAFDQDGAGGSASSSVSSGVGASGTSTGTDAASTSSGSGGTPPACIGSTSSSSSGGVEGSKEISCTDGLDNDDDGATDCEDADCTSAGYTCDFKPPDGWEGPGVYFEGTPGNLPCCPSDYPVGEPFGGDKPTADPVACSGCVCKGTITCQATGLSAYADNTCSLPVPLIQDGSCHPLTGVTAAFTATQPMFSPATSCTSTGGTVLGTPPPASWSLVAHVCSLPNAGKSCQVGGRACSRPSTDAPSGLCVWQAGVPACPPGYPNAHTFFQQIEEGRGCTQCACGAPESGGSCAVTTALYSSTDCADPATKLDDLLNPVTCFEETNAKAYTTTTNPSPPNCPATGGLPTGSVTSKLGTEVTVCCTKG